MWLSSRQLTQSFQECLWVFRVPGLSCPIHEPGCLVRISCVLSALSDTRHAASCNLPAVSSGWGPLLALFTASMKEACLALGDTISVCPRLELSALVRPSPSMLCSDNDSPGRTGEIHTADPSSSCRHLSHGVWLPAGICLFNMSANRSISIGPHMCPRAWKWSVLASSCCRSCISWTQDNSSRALRPPESTSLILCPLVCWHKPPPCCCQSASEHVSPCSLWWRPWRQSCLFSIRQLWCEASTTSEPKPPVRVPGPSPPPTLASKHLSG